MAILVNSWSYFNLVHSPVMGLIVLHDSWYIRRFVVSFLRVVHTVCTNLVLFVHPLNPLFNANFDVMDAPETCECYVPSKAPTVKISKGRKRKHHVEGDVAVDSFSVDSWERMNIYTGQWGKIEAKIMKLTSEFFHKYVEKLNHFVLRYSSGEQAQLLGDQQAGFNFGLIPVAMITLSMFNCAHF